MDEQDDSSVQENNIKENKTILKYDLGLDISTTTIGYAFICCTNPSLVDIGYIKPTTNTQNDFFDKVLHSTNQLLKLYKTNESHHSIQNIYIEESAKRFMPGFSSADTILTLAKFNGIISYEMWKITGIKPTYINVNSARKALSIKVDRTDKSKSTKQKVFEIVKNMNPTFKWETYVASRGAHSGQTVYKKENEDMCDAWVICRGGQCLAMKPTIPARKK